MCRAKVPSVNVKICCIATSTAGQEHKSSASAPCHIAGRATQDVYASSTAGLRVDGCDPLSATISVGLLLVVETSLYFRSR